MIAPDLTFWIQLFTRLAVEAAGVTAMALLVERFVRAAFWRRTLWQSTMVCLLLVTASELTGFGRGLASYFFGHPREEQKLFVTTTTVKNDALLTAPVPMSRAPIPAMTLLPAVKPETAQPVWWPGFLWLAGAAVIGIRILVTQILFITLRHRRVQIKGNELSGRVSDLLLRLGARGKICLLESSRLTSPIAFGVLRPSIGLPSDFATRYTVAEQNAMLAHELAHLVSRDPAWYVLADAGSAALWWHPPTWWSRRRLQRASELAADEAAVILPGGPTVLAECLVSLGKQITQRAGAGSMGVEGGFRSHLAERVQRLLGLTETTRRPSFGWKAQVARGGLFIMVSAAAISVTGSLQGRDAVKQPTLRADLNQSWEASPVSTLWQSRLRADEGKAPAPATAQPVKNVLAAQDEPRTNSNPGRGPNAGRATLLRTLRAIKISAMPEVFEKGLPLSEVMPLLHQISVTNDLENIGVNFMFKPRGNSSAQAVLDPTAPPPAPADPSTINIKIPPLSNITLEQALDAICHAAENGAPTFPGLTYAVEDYAVWFYVKPSDDRRFEIRIFHVDTNTFLPGLRDVTATSMDGAHGGSVPPVTNLTADASGVVAAYFARMGLNLTNNGGFVMYSKRAGDLLVRSTPDNLDVVEHVIQSLNMVPPRLQLDVKFAMVPRNGDHGNPVPTNIVNYTLNIFTNSRPAQGFGTPATESGQNDIKSSTSSVTTRGPGHGASDPANPSSALTNTDPMIGLLDDAQFRTVIQAVEQRNGADIFTAQRATTESGQSAHVSVSDVDLVSSSNSVVTVKAGPALDIIPTISADGYSIKMVLNLTLTEFTGYERSGPFLPQSQTVNGGNSSPAPVPHYQVRQTVNTIDALDGQTIVLGQAELAGGTNSAQDLLIFITPRIIDAAGNAVHTEADMPLAHPPPAGPGAQK